MLGRAISLLVGNLDGPGKPSTLPVRNRRTAVGLVAWIVFLMLVSALVAWFRN